MDAATFNAAWSSVAVESFTTLGQPVLWNNRTITAIVDGLPYSDAQRSAGGGFGEEFQGTILFLKSAFTAPCWPQMGDKIAIGHRYIKILDVAGIEDAADPIITCAYGPVPK